MKKHNWICVVSIPITEAEAEIAVRTGKVDRDVTLKDVDFMGMGCYDCEEPLTKKSINTACQGVAEA